MPIGIAWTWTHTLKRKSKMNNLSQTTINYAKDWFTENQYKVTTDNDQFTLHINGNIFILDPTELKYRAELQLDSLLEEVKTD